MRIPFQGLNVKLTSDTGVKYEGYLTRAISGELFLRETNGGTIYCYRHLLPVYQTDRITLI